MHQSKKLKPIRKIRVKPEICDAVGNDDKICENDARIGENHEKTGENYDKIFKFTKSTPKTGSIRDIHEFDETITETKDKFTEKWIQKIQDISEIESLPDSGVESTFDSAFEPIFDREATPHNLHFSMITLEQDKPVKFSTLNDSYFEDDYIIDLVGKDDQVTKLDNLHKEAIRIGQDLRTISSKTRKLKRTSQQIDQLLYSSTNY